MAEEDDQLEEAYRYWHDLGFDEGYEVGFEDGLSASKEPVTDENGLMPCPLCGGKARIRHMYVAGEPSHSRVECTECNVKTDFYVYEYGERNVIRVWNRRAGDKD